MTGAVRHYLHRAVDCVLSPKIAWWWTQGVIVGLYRDLNKPWLVDLKPATVLDIGANVGRFAITARKLFPEAHIYAFEPLADCLAQADRIMRGDRKFTPVNVALGAKRGCAAFERNAASASSSLLRMTRTHAAAFPGTAPVVEMTVQVEALDRWAATLALELPIFVKIDVQGFEDPVLLGGEKTLARASVILIETSFETLYEGQALFEDIHRRLTNWNFDFKGNVDQAYAPLDGRLLQADSLFVKRGVLA